MLPPAEWLEVDRYALALTRRLQEQCAADYERFEFHKVVQALMNFCSEDLGAFHLDILKDRLYTAAENSRARRSAQSALWHILQTVTRLMAPILSFTAEEIWATLKQGDSVMLDTWHPLPAQAEESALVARWQAIRVVRASAGKFMEDLRTEGKIGSSLQAEVTITASGPEYEVLASLGDDLRFVLLCSKTVLRQRSDGTAMSIEVVASSNMKCGRCWHWRDDVGRDAAHPDLCGRCVSNLHGAGEAREFA
jgi:isoleucyl-tRNA synthetase